MIAGKRIIITGGTRGIGKALALGFAAEGAIVGVTYKKNTQQASQLTTEMQAFSNNFLINKADVTDRVAVKRFFENYIEKFHGIDVLINNAGINHRCDFLDISDEEWDEIFNTNLKGAFICSQEVVKLMQGQGAGRIINISSVAGQYHGPRTVHYAVSKAALISLTKVLARICAPDNILVNAVAPGLILTDQTADEFKSTAYETVVGMTLLKRHGELEDVVNACLFLADDKQGYITGQVLSVSGGAYLG